MLTRSLAWLPRPGALVAKVRRTIRRWRGTARFRAALDSDDLLVEVGPVPASGLISIVLPVFRVAEEHLRAALASVRSQTWRDWELIAVDDAAPEPHVARVLADATRDPRIRVVRRATNGGVSVASNDAVAQARGEFVAFLDHDDELAPRALELVARFLAAKPGTDWLFTDEDKLDGRGRHAEPMFKPGWSRHLLLGFNLAGHLRVVRRSTIEGAGGHRLGFEGAQDYDLALRVLAAGGRFAHLPGPLYHWRRVRASMARVAAAKPEANARALEALIQHVRGFPRGGGVSGRVIAPGASLFRVRREAEPDLSIAVAAQPGDVLKPTVWGMHPTVSLQVGAYSVAELVAACAGTPAEVVALPPPSGFATGQLEELLALLQVPGTALAAGRSLTGHRVTASGWVLNEEGRETDPWAGLHRADPGYMNLALLPGRRLVPPRTGWVAWRENLLSAWDAAPGAPEPWRLAVGLAQLDLEVVTTPDVNFPSHAGVATPLAAPIPASLPHDPLSRLARIGLLP